MKYQYTEQRTVCTCGHVIKIEAVDYKKFTGDLKGLCRDCKAKKSK